MCIYIYMHTRTYVYMLYYIYLYIYVCIDIYAHIECSSLSTTSEAWANVGIHSKIRQAVDEGAIRQSCKRTHRHQDLK